MNIYMAGCGKEGWVARILQSNIAYNQLVALTLQINGKIDHNCNNHNHQHNDK